MTTGTIASPISRQRSRMPSPESAQLVDIPTPYLVTDLDVVADRLASFTAALPGVSTFYAMKCNPAPEILAVLAAQGASFEIASIGELRMLQAIGVDPARVLYSNPVKPPAMIAAAASIGLWRFCFDSPNELAKIAERAPGSAVYVRLRVDDTDSQIPLSRKFGAEADDAYELMLRARELGLRPYGVTFHVGSQCTNPRAWQVAIRSAGELMARLRTAGIELEMLDIGGGFPVPYRAVVPTMDEIGLTVERALAELPYRPALFAAEPGRHLVGESAVMAAAVIGRGVRGAENWLYVEVSAYHGLMEALQASGGWEFPMWSSLPQDDDTELLPFTITGPSCDSSDTIGENILLPAALTVDDVLYIGSAGAYTLSFATSFNGFAPPTPIYLGTGSPSAGCPAG